MKCSVDKTMSISIAFLQAHIIDKSELDHNFLFLSNTHPKSVSNAVGELLGPVYWP